jgi:hypothetical protein
MGAHGFGRSLRRQVGRGEVAAGLDTRAGLDGNDRRGVWKTTLAGKASMAVEP